MKTIIIVFLFLYSFALINAQNLIPNSGFDSITTCQFANTQIHEIIPPWFSALDSFQAYHLAIGVFNKCSTSIESSVPSNLFGFSYQPALSGNGYTNLYVYSFEDRGAYGRGYLETPLLKPLNKYSQYFVQFYVSPIDMMESLGFRMTYTDGIGLLFTDTILVRKGTHIVVPPSIDNTRGRLIKDTVGWTAIRGCYKARGGERYATIGNFRSNAETRIEVEDSTDSTPSAVLYIDDVSVLEYNPLPDTLYLCQNETKSYNAAFQNSAVKWSTGSMDSIITISKSGVYSVSVNMEDCVLTDTVVVIVPPDPQNKMQILRGDTTLCQGKKIELSAAAVPGQYTWSTGSVAARIEVSKTDNYAVTVTNRCGSYSDDATITFKKCACNVYVPTAFSPNGDGVNDELQVYFGCDFDYKVKRFQIFNRWGGLVFSQENTNTIKWDGQVNSHPLSPDTYAWYLEYEYTNDGKTETVIESGDFTIFK